MKKLLLIIFTLSLCVNIDAQYNFEYQEECGNPLSSSFAYRGTRKGKVTKVVNGNTIIFKQSEGFNKQDKGTFTVYLAGIDSTLNEENLKKFLIENVLNKKISIYGNVENDSDNHLFGILWGAGFADINQYILQNGLADYSRPDYIHSVSSHTLCIYRQEVKKAKEAKLGIWAK